MNNSEILSILLMTESRTIGKHLSWEKVSDDEFQVSFPKSSILIRQYQIDDATCYSFLLFNQKGEVIFEVNNDNIKAMFSHREPLEALHSPKDPFNFLPNLCETISNQYYQVDDTIKDLLNNLDASDLV